MSSTVTRRPVLASAGACASALNVPKVTATVNNNTFVTFITYLFLFCCIQLVDRQPLTASPNWLSCKNPNCRTDEATHRLSHFPPPHPTSEIIRRSDENRSKKSSLTLTRTRRPGFSRPGLRL